MMWIKRTAIVIVSLLVSILILLVGSIIVDNIRSDGSAALTNVEYTQEDGTILRGYLAEPDSPGPHPAVLLIHEWWGFNEGIVILADALAEEGYVVLAADAYRGEVTSQVPRALYLRLTTPEEQVFSDLVTGLTYLRGLASVDADRVASMGFCFGGGQSLQLGLRESENLAMTIIYYGSLVTDAELLRPLTETQPVLGVFAENDQQIFVEDVLEFESALDSLGITNQITVYPDVGHGFINEDNFNQPGTAGDAWQEAI
ncbi:MAG: dienelactone hydrolase family protein, partial [Chloroflexi bacterium]|nr:dienelactone hydrolase family protein [Chloroflexota bacterium]